jgi:hypothetical protein
LPEPVGDVLGVALIQVKFVPLCLISIIREFDCKAFGPGEFVNEEINLVSVRNLAMPVTINPMANLWAAAVKPKDGAPPPGIASAEILLLCDCRRDERDRRLIVFENLPLTGQP